MTTTRGPRIRDLYLEYLNGRLPFDELMAVADRRLAQFDAEHSLPNPEPHRTQP